MVNWISGWARNIIVAVILGTVIEMILPDNNAKKYIKIIIGIFIVYAVIEPISSNSLKMQMDEIITNQQAVIETGVSAAMNNTSAQSSISIKTVYAENLKKDMESRLRSTGYVVDNLVVNIRSDDSYDIESVELHIKEKQCSDDEKQVQSVVDTVKSVIVKIDKRQEESVLNSYDMDKIRKLFKSNYNIDANNLRIS